jgi:hypothetical protein
MQLGGSAEKKVETFSGIKAAHGQDGEPARVRLGGMGIE